MLNTKTRMKLRRIEDNINYIINVNNSNSIYGVKNKLSYVLKLNCEEIILIHKNRVLKNDKLISDYNIDENDFVLFSDGEMKYRIIKRKNENYKPKQLNEDEKITVGYLYYDQIDTKKRKRVHCNDTMLNKNKEFANCAIRDGASIHRDTPTLSWAAPRRITMTCITGHYDPFQILYSRNISNIFNEILGKIKIPQRNIKLFLDKNRSKPIESDNDIPKPYCLQSRTDDLQLYFNVEPDFENLVKLEKLGEGSFGTVFKCVSIETKGEMVVKKLKIPTTDKAKEDKLSFERELQVYSKHSDHPRIVKYERNFKTENAVFLVMEYMKGGSLGGYIRKNGPLSENKIKKYSKQILEALQYLHEQKILHRDIKSDNILLDEDDNVKLCDFGLSKILTDLAAKDFLNGAIQSSVGTPNYMAPEIMNEEPYGSSADVWSFGATMVEMVTGFPPYHQMGVCKVMKIISESRKIEYNYPNDLSDNLKSFIDSCLQSEPARRLTSKQLMNHPFLRKFELVFIEL